MKRFTVDAAMPNWAKTPLPRGPVPARRVLEQADMGAIELGTLAHMLLERILKEHPGAKVTAQIHDECLIELPKKET